MKRSHSEVLRVIAVFKLLKAASLIAIGVGAFKMIHADVGSVLQHWVAVFSFDPDSPFINHLVQKVTNISPRRFRELGIGSFIYACLFLTEGIGLWLLKRWAEWFTVIITSSLVPVEVYEIFHRPTAIKVLVFFINVAVIVYLVYHIKRNSRSAH